MFDVILANFGIMLLCEHIFCLKYILALQLYNLFFMFSCCCMYFRLAFIIFSQRCYLYKVSNGTHPLRCILHADI